MERKEGRPRREDIYEKKKGERGERKKGREEGRETERERDRERVMTKDQ